MANPVELGMDLSDKYEIQTAKRKNVEFEEAVEETGFGKYHMGVVLTCGFLVFTSIVETYSVGYIIPAAECELNLDNYTKGILTSCSTAGVIMGSITWGLLADIKGRRRLIILNLILAFISGEAAAVMPYFWGLVILRLINGICMSCPAAICYVYLGEFLCTKTRSKSMACASSFVAIAILYLSSSGWLILQKTINVQFLGLRLTNWRVYMMINSLPSILTSICLSRLPESPKYLYSVGKPEEALAVLRKMYASSTGRPEDSYPVETLSEKVLLEQPLGSKKSALQLASDQIFPLFKPPLLVYTLAAATIMAGILAISSGLLFWYPNIVNQVTKSRRESVTVCEALSNGFTPKAVLCDDLVEDRVFILNLVIGGYYFVAYAAWGFVVRLLGTRNLFITLMGAATLSTVLVCFLTEKTLIDIFFISALTLPGIGVSVMNAWVVEIFPTKVGGMAFCTIMTIGRIGAVTSSAITGIMLEWNCFATFVLCAITLLVCLALSLLLPQKGRA